jgi:hypothetical protein
MPSWKKSTVTPAGGVSVTVMLTGTSAWFVTIPAPPDIEDPPPHPEMKTENTAMMKNAAALRIFALLVAAGIRNRRAQPARSLAFRSRKLVTGEGRNLMNGCSGSGQGCSF